MAWISEFTFNPQTCIIINGCQNAEYVPCIGRIERCVIFAESFPKFESFVVWPWTLRRT